MLAASTFEEIEEAERQVSNSEIVVFLFVRPEEENILREFEYIHYNSGKYCSIYAIGYTDDSSKKDVETYRKVDVRMEKEWYYSSKVFVDFKNRLEERIQWEYSGEVEILILQNNPGERNVLNFQHYVAIAVNKGIKEGYIDSFQSFMESLVRNAKKHVSAKDAINGIRKDRIKIKEVL